MIRIKLTFFVIICNLVFTVGIGNLHAQDDSTTIPGNTIAIVNLRSGPGTGFDVLGMVESRVPVTFVGRNASSTWLQVIIDTDGHRGWLSYTFVNVEGSVMRLPVVNNTFSTTVVPSVRSDQPAAGAPPADAPLGVVPSASAFARSIFLRGQQLGNRPDVFSKVGDSITASELFLSPIGHGGLQLHEYEYLRPVVDYFSQTSAGSHFSFANKSVAARSGWTAGDVLDSGSAYSFCAPNEAPLVCEYRLTKPSVALIMFGTNDAIWVDSYNYRNDMIEIVEISIEMGVIPVLSTIPDQFRTNGAGRVGEFNDIIRNITATYDIPLWDYWLALQSLPDAGISGDGVHPSYNAIMRETAIFTADELRFGLNMRNLTALMVLDAVWRGAMY